MWLLDNSGQDVGAESDEAADVPDFIFPILMHPDTSGMAHIIGMAERMIGWLKSLGSVVEFSTHENIARPWLAAQKAKAEKAKPNL